MAKNKDDGKDAKGKGKAAGKGGKRGGGGGGENVISIAAHPRAGAHVRQAKGWCGLLGFVLAAYLSLSAGVPLVQAGERALLAGAAGLLVGWAVSVTVWRQLMLAELHAAAERVVARRAELTTAQPVLKPRD